MSALIFILLNLYYAKYLEFSLKMRESFGLLILDFIRHKTQNTKCLQIFFFLIYTKIQKKKSLGGQ